mgnify:CR=1 FL=1
MHVIFIVLLIKRLQIINTNNVIKTKIKTYKDFCFIINITKMSYQLVIFYKGKHMLIMQGKPFLEKDYVEISIKKNITSWSSLLNNKEQKNVVEKITTNVIEPFNLLNKLNDPEYKFAILQALTKQKKNNIKKNRINHEEEVKYSDDYEESEEDYTSWCDEHYDTDIYPVVEELYKSTSDVLQHIGVYTNGSKSIMEDWLFETTDMSQYMNDMYSKYTNNLQYNVYNNNNNEDDEDLA